MKHFLLLTYGFPPAPLAYSQRVAKLCKYLPREGHWVPRVICGELSNDPTLGVDNSLLAEIPPEITVDRVGSFLDSRLAQRLRSWHLYKPIGLFRKFTVKPDAYGDWISRAVNLAQKRFPNGEGIEAILASGPPNSVYVAGVHLSKQWGVPLVIDMRDPWLLSWGKFTFLQKWQYRQTRTIEEGVYQEAAAIITNTPGNYNALKESFPLYASKMVMIPNGFDPEDLNWHSGPSLREPGEHPDTVHLLYLGGVRGEGFEDPFFKALAAYLKDNPKMRPLLKVHFIGAPAKVLSNLLNPWDLHDVCRGYGVIPTNHVGRPLAQADIYVLLLPYNAVKGWIPSKIYYYLAGGKYIFAMVPNGSTKDLLASMPDLSFISKPEEDTAKDVLARLIEKTRQFRRPQPGDSIPPFAMTYDRRAIARQVGAVLDQVVAARKLPT